MSKSSSKLKDELDIVNLIKNGRITRINTKKNKYNAKTKFLVDHSQKNMINLETSTDEDDSDRET